MASGIKISESIDSIAGKAVSRLADEQLGTGYLTESELSHPDLRILVARYDDSIVGFITYHILETSSLASSHPELFNALPSSFYTEQRIGQIGSLVVANAWQKQGIGTCLMSNVLQNLAMTVSSVFLLGWQTASGTNVQALAEKLGFERGATIADYWNESSRLYGYACPSCGQPPCHCKAVIFSKSL